jgi:hypothetical protein
MTIGSLLRAGFGLIRAQPVVIAIWTALYLAAGLIGLALMLPAMTAMTTATPTLDVAGVQSAMAWMWLFDVLLFVVITVIFAAIFRAVFWPEQRGFAYLRLGIDEFLLIVLMLLFFVVAFVATLVAVLLGGIVVGLIAATAGYGAATLLGVVLAIALGCVMIWLEVRLSLAFPLTVLRKRLAIGEAWALTRGRFWTLFGAYLVSALIVVIVSTIIFWPMMAGYFGDMMRAGDDPQRMNLVMQAQMARVLHPGIGMIVAWVLGGLVYTIGLTLIGGIQASATAMLAGETAPDIAA